jgi:hypothetical protein
MLVEKYVIDRRLTDCKREVLRHILGHMVSPSQVSPPVTLFECTTCGTQLPSSLFRVDNGAS